MKRLGRAGSALVWGALAVVMLLPIGAAAGSPLLAWRQPVYIAAGFAGIAAMALLLLQPLLIGAYLPGLSARQTRRLHRAVGAVLIFALGLHVGGLWLTSPPDVIDALLFVSPTPFSDWGVIALWATAMVAILAGVRRRLGLRPRVWRLAHMAFAAVAVVGSVMHAMLIEGTMEIYSKAALCAVAVLATLKLCADLRVWSLNG